MAPAPQTPPPPPVSRFMVGVAVVLCLCLAGWRLLVTAEPHTDPLLAAAWRVAIVMAALWWVMPIRGEGWVWRRVAVVVVPALLLVALRGRALLIALPILLVLSIVAAMIRPRPKGRRYNA